MGVVYRAEQTEPIQREVALKVVRRGLDSGRVVARFESERQTLALMDHPNIARVLDAGSDDQGNPYFVMELVRGIPVTEYAKQRTLSTRQRLELFATACRAAHHAHMKGIIHRDLKPSNILVTTHDDLPLPKIIDFGIAKAMDVEASAATLTQEGWLLGTLEYMSPEQARGAPGGIDTRSDVYSLGVILYELLTEGLPYEVRGLPFVEAVHAIENQAPRPIRQTSTSERKLDSDIETIVLKALEKDPDRRYGSAAEFADDIDRFLRSEPISARPPSTIYQLRKLAQRHRWPFAFATTFVILLVAFVITLSIQLQAQHRERTRAETEATKATRISEFLQDMLASVNPAEKNVDVRVRELLDDAARQVDFGLAEEPETEAALRRTIGNTYLALGLYEEANDQLTRALDLREGIHGDDHPLVGESLADLVAFHLGGAVDQDAVAAADSLCQRALAIRSNVWGEDHPETASSLLQLAKILRIRSELVAAESVIVRALDIQERSLGEDHLDVAKSLISLTWMLGDLNRREEGEACLRRAVEIVRNLYPGDHPEVAAALAALSGFVGFGGKGQEAESLAVEVLAMERRMWGERHPRVAQALTQLATGYTYQNHLAEAEPLHREALEILIAFHGERSTSAAEGHNSLGHFLWLKGDYAQAEEEFRTAISIWREKARDSWSLGMGLNNLALLLGERFQDDEATDLFLESLEIFEKVWGVEHFHVALSHNNFAVFLINRGRYREAEPHIRTAVAGWTEVLGETHTNTATAMANLASLLFGTDRLGEAETLFRKSLAAHEATAVPDSWTMNHLIAATNLGRCLHHQGHLREAEEILQEAKAEFPESVVGMHPRYAQLLCHLGSLCVDLAKHKEAEDALIPCLRYWMEESPDKRLIPYGRNALAACLAAQGRTAEADSLFALSSPDAWTRALIPAEGRIAWERALRFYESMGRVDQVAQMQATRP
jgi:serine/threonine protein kinase/tetratricopeptide (TPR) repeat protein